MMRLLLTALVFSFFAVPGFSYPEQSRHGYANCTSCHVSPSGGGLLTPYGRELSKEILSTWSKDGEQNFAYGLLTTDEKILLGAFVRGLQVQSEDEQKKEGRAILMQADVEGAYNTDQWALVGSFGRQEIRSGMDSKGRAFSRRHYALYRAGEAWNVRVGKFLRSFGLNDPNHNLFVRRDLNFGFDTETYNLELSYLGEVFSSSLTYVNGQTGKDEYTRLQENGWAWNNQLFFFEKQKVGFSLYQGEDDSNKRWVAGPWWVFNLPANFFLLSEIDYQERELTPPRERQKGSVMSHRLAYEPIQGVIPFLSYDKRHLNREDALNEVEATGLGLQFFPRPHWEFVGSWQKERAVGSQKSSDLIWLLTHFYL